MNGTNVTWAGAGLSPTIDPQDARTYAVRLPGGVTYAAGTCLGMVTHAANPPVAVNEVQTITITGTPTGGTVRLIFNGAITGTIAYDATAATVQTALEALENIGTGNVLCAGGPFPGTAITATFRVDLGGADVPLMLATSALTGGTSPAIAVTLTTRGRPAGALFAAYDDSLSDGTNIMKAILKERVTTYPNGTIRTATSQMNQGELAATAYYAGVFDTSLLTGIDANGVADCGRIISGGTTTLTTPGNLLRMM